MKTKISSTLAWLAKLAISAALSLVMQINNDKVRIVLSSLLMSAEQTITALSDSNPDDEAQMKQILNDVIVTSQMSDLVKTILEEKFQNLKEPYGDITTTMLSLLFDTGDILTDSDGDNRDQINSQFKSFFEGPDGLMFITRLLQITPLDPATATIIASSIAQFVATQFPGQTDQFEDLIAKISNSSQKYTGVALINSPKSTQTYK